MPVNPLKSHRSFPLFEVLKVLSAVSGENDLPNMNSATTINSVRSGSIALAMTALAMAAFAAPAQAQSESGGLLLTPEEMLTEADMEMIEPAKAVVPVKSTAPVKTAAPAAVAPAQGKGTASPAAKTAQTTQSGSQIKRTKVDRTDFIGMADYYHHSLYGRKTSSGRVLHPHLMTAAHRTLPFGTRVRVTNKSSGKSCIVEINDRGPFTKNKVIDLSHAAAKHLGMIQAGTCKVACTVLNETEE